MAFRFLWGSCCNVYGAVMISLRARQFREIMRRCAIGIAVCCSVIGLILGAVHVQHVYQLRQLVGQLTDPNDGVREHAADDLEFFDEGGIFDVWRVYDKSRAVEPLVAALKDKDSKVRSNAAKALGHLARTDPRAAEPLVAALKDPDSEVRSNAAEALGTRTDPRAVEALIATLRDSDSKVRAMVVRSLSDIKDPRVVGLLIAALNDRDPGVGESAVSVLGEISGCDLCAGGAIKDPHVVEALIPTLKNEDSSVPWAAVLLWYKITDPRARAAEPLIAARIEPLIAARVEPLIAALKGGKDARARMDAAEALRKIGAPAVDSLIATLKDKDRNIRLYAAYTLDGIDDSRAFDAEEASGLWDVVFDASGYEVTIGSGKPGSEDGLIEALDAFGNAQMAVIYLNSGNPRLEAAGSRWGTEHGYEVNKAVDNNARVVKWGGLRP
jgi:HEAT repeat protein